MSDNVSDKRIDYCEECGYEGWRHSHSCKMDQQPAPNTVEVDRGVLEWAEKELTDYFVDHSGEWKGGYTEAFKAKLKQFREALER